MNSITLWILILASSFVFFSYVLLKALLKAVKQVTETNKQLLIVVAGQSGKPETTGAIMRTLVASEKPPQGKLRGIAPAKKEPKKPSNTDYKMQIGVK